MYYTCVFLLVSSLAVSFGDVPSREARIVSLDQGPVRGYREDGHNFFSFYGIPYARAPTGDHKFKGPLPPPTWKSIFDATSKNILCPQSNMVHEILPNIENYLMTEDCLIANVFTPNSEGSLPVVVYVHGGALQIGFGNMLMHTPLLKTGKVVIVNFNYRLGTHGFLCLGTEDVPGNAGFKDQVAALRWVQANVAKFGGNPHDVTIAGYSAGAASVQLLTLSELTKGLFHKAIPESGDSLMTPALQLNPLKDAKKFALESNFKNVDDIEALEKFYKTTSLHVLLETSFMVNKNSNFKFGACVEGDTSEEKFLSEAPINILKKGNYQKVPLLVGFSNMEGLFRFPLYELWKESMNSKFSDFLPFDLEFKNEKEKELVANEIKKFYFRDDSITAQGYIDYFTDVIFALGHLRSLKLNLAHEHDSIYLYEYSYVVDDSQTRKYNIRGADHCAQSMAITESLYSKFPESEEYNKVKDMLVDIWINFITTGKPVLQKSKIFPSGWPALTRENSAYMELNSTPELRKGLLKERFELWDKIYEKYYKVPIPPPSHKLNIRNEL